ncbi:MAG TPA: phosphotransferase [Acidimicrobiales bacterium]|nr:phosphotransferase [Acidimicrobiales bacterium]
MLMDDRLTMDVTEALVRDLLDDQHPDLAGLSVRRADRGWDNAVFRLGDDLALRIPQRIAGAILIEHEREWLPTILDGVPDFGAGGLDASPHLRDGHAACGYPWSWAIIPWHHGDVAAHAAPVDPVDAARRLGRFCAALHRPAQAGAPDNPWRGGPVPDRGAMLAEHLDRVEFLGRTLGEGVDRREVETAFAELAAVEADTGPPSWLHGDLHLGNLIVRDGALRAAIDFGDVTAGDRATDLSVAWPMFPDDDRVRSTFRTVAGTHRAIDDATWTRARAWSIALGVAYLQGAFTTPERTEIASRGLAAALAGP